MTTFKINGKLLEFKNSNDESLKVKLNDVRAIYFNLNNMNYGINFHHNKPYQIITKETYMELIEYFHKEKK